LLPNTFGAAGFVVPGSVVFGACPGFGFGCLANDATPLPGVQREGCVQRRTRIRDTTAVTSDSSAACGQMPCRPSYAERHLDGKAEKHAARRTSYTAAMRAVFVMVKTDPGYGTEVANRLAEVASFSEAYSITGQYDLLVKLYIEDVDGLGRLIERDIHSIPHIRDTFTILTFEAFGTR
jgi:DNA-binding Lrp family transcriptional regulator